MTHRWMKFWPGDWKGDSALRMCGLAARGLWIECIAIMHDAQPYGHLIVNGRAPNARQLAAIVGGTERDVERLLTELEEAGVFSRTEGGVIFSRRMLRDAAKSQQGRDHITRRWGNGGGEGGANGEPSRPDGRHPNERPNRSPNTLEAEAEAEAEKKKKKPPSPFGSGERAAPPDRRADGTNPKAVGASPRQVGDNPRRPGVNPRAFPHRDAFDAFWRYWPKRVAKGEAEKAWPAAVRAAAGDPGVIVDGLKCRLHVASLFDPREDGRFIPHPATWLRRRGWEDAIPGVEPPPPAQSSLLRH